MRHEQARRFKKGVLAMLLPHLGWATGNLKAFLGSSSVHLSVGWEKQFQRNEEYSSLVNRMSKRGGKWEAFVTVLIALVIMFLIGKFLPPPTHQN